MHYPSMYVRILFPAASVLIAQLLSLFSLFSLSISLSLILSLSSPRVLVAGQWWQALSSPGRNAALQEQAV